MQNGVETWRGTVALALFLAVACGPSGEKTAVLAAGAPSAKTRPRPARPMRPEVSATRRPLAPLPTQGSIGEPATVLSWLEVLQSPEAGFFFADFPEEFRCAQAQRALADEFRRELESDRQALAGDTVGEVLERFPYGDPMWGPIPGTLGLLLRASPSEYVLDLMEVPDGDAYAKIWSAHRALYAESVQWTGVGRLLYTYVSRATRTRAMSEFVHTQPLRAFLGEELLHAVDQEISKTGVDPVHWNDSLGRIQSDLEATGEAVEAHLECKRGTPLWEARTEEVSVAFDRTDASMEAARSELAPFAEAARERMLLAIAADHPDAYFFAKIAKRRPRPSRF